MGPEAIVVTFITLSICLLIFGIVYVRNKENMALIERGINPRISDPRPRHFVNLKWGLLLAGAGLGLLIAYFIDINTTVWVTTPNGERYQQDNPAIYFSLIAIGGGIGLVLSYFIEKRHWKEIEKKDKL
ncbi:hypothetical protein GCM10023093_04540 [Nemorincola caseinilytica]|uniref:DUF6249 domain-containing protein n=1 Tax=Nemorincola caseinilytica TaxID=2054315 RepID=A0ABP8N5P2_9BACT